MKFEWDKEEAKFFNTLWQTAAILGIMVGCLFGGKLITIGRRKVLLIMNAVVVVGILVTLIFNVWIIALGRLICGYAAGVMSIIAAKALNETVPKELSSEFGILTNIYICFGILVATLAGFILPTDIA